MRFFLAHPLYLQWCGSWFFPLSLALAADVALRIHVRPNVKREPGSFRSSADAEGPRDAQQILNITLGKACNRRMTFKDTQGHYKIATVT